MKEFENSFQYFLHLLSCGVFGGDPCEKPEKFSWDEIAAYSYNHSVEAPVFLAVKKLSPVISKETFAKWREIYFKAITRDSIQLEEFAKIKSALTESGINLLPFKGIVMKTLYPDSCLRSMGDIDIYYEAEDYEKAREILESFGYTCETWNDDKVLEDNFSKPPIMFVELHRVIFDEDKLWQKYFDNILERAVVDEENKNLYYMTDEDFYIQLIMHAAKHFQYAGFGVKPILDLHIFNIKKALDYDKINGVLEEYGLSKFHSLLRKCGKCWFDGEAPDSEVSEMERFIKNSFDYVNSEKARFDNINDRSGGSESAKKGRLKYLLSIIFVPKHIINDIFPGSVGKPAILLPFYHIARWFKILFNPGNVKKNIDAGKNLTQEKLDFYMGIEKIAGLKISDEHHK